MLFHPRRALLLLPVAFVGGCEGCIDPEVVAVAPQIAIDACTTPAAKPTSDCLIDFGNADITVQATKTFTISNPSALILDLSEGVSGKLGITLDDEALGNGFSFASALPDEIGPGLSADVAVTIRPILESTIEGNIIIVSDANNTPQNADRDSVITIPLTLTGVDNGVPDLVVTPDPSCGTADPLNVDFGRVATGGGKVCNVTVQNVGTRELVFDGVDFLDGAGVDTVAEAPGSDAAPAIRLAGEPPRPDQPLPPDASIDLRVAFAPDVLGRYTAVLAIRSSDPDEGLVEVPIVGTGVNAPSCDARVKSVNGVDVTGVPTVEPLDDVVIIADAEAATPDGSIVEYRWELLERGPGSGAVLANPSAAETGFAFANRRGVDVAGRFEACVVVVDDLGTESAEPCCVNFEAIPQDAFLVQLTWVGDQTDDMDLHVTKRSGAAGSPQYCVTSLGGGSGNVDAPFSECGTNDCGFYNCNPTDTGVEWDGVPGRTAGDPSLDIDDVDGFGPENINVDVTDQGSYGFGASYFGGSIPVVMFMRLFLFGQLAGEWVETVDDDFWEVGIVHFDPEDPFHPCVEDLINTPDDDECAQTAE